MMIVMYRISGKYSVSDIIQTNIIISGWNFILIVASLLLQNFILFSWISCSSFLFFFLWEDRNNFLRPTGLSGEVSGIQPDNYPTKYPTRYPYIRKQYDVEYPISDINFTIWYIPSKNLLNLWQIWQNFFRFLYDSEQ